jgi:hypothetical protein
MDARKNPFAPGAGTPPPELAGREKILEDADVVLDRVRLGRSSRSQILVGLRGVGKTVLLNRIRGMAEAKQFHALLIEAHEDKSLPALLIPPLRRLLLRLDSEGGLSEATKTGLRVLRSFIGRFKAKVKVGELAEIELGVDPERGVADSGDLESDLSDLLLAVARAAEDRGAHICLLIDELQYLDDGELSALIMALHQVSQRNLPLVLVAAALPLILGMSGRSKSYAERLFTFPSVGALAEAAACTALQAPAQEHGANFSDDALAEILATTERYPYFLQQWGYEAWNVAESTQITLQDVKGATVKAIQQLDESFFRVRFDRLTRREKDFLFAMAALNGTQQRSGDIAEKLGVKVNAIGPLRSGLIVKGMIYSPAHGDNAFTVPLFDAFLKRQMTSPGISAPRAQAHR